MLKGLNPQSTAVELWSEDVAAKTNQTEVAVCSHGGLTVLCGKDRATCLMQHRMAANNELER